MSGYRELAAEATRVLRRAEEARLRLAEAEDARSAAYASVEADWGRLDELDRRAAGIWKELTTRFGTHMTGPLPEPVEDPDLGADAEELLREAHRRVREPVDHLLTGRYVRMGLLGLTVAAVPALLGLELAESLPALGRFRSLVAYGPALAAPGVGHVAAAMWIRARTSHEEREYAADTAIAGTFGGGVVWLIGLIFLIVHLVT